MHRSFSLGSSSAITMTIKEEMQKSFTHVRILKLTASLCLILCHSHAFSSNGMSRDSDHGGACYKHSQSGSCEKAIFPDHDSSIKDPSGTNAETDKMTREFYKPDPRFHGVYTFPTNSIPRRNCSDEEAMHYLQEGLPVVLENCTFPRSALKWTTKYLSENLRDENHTAYLSTNRRFLYFDEDRLKGNFKLWKPPTTKMLISFKHFLDLVQELETANNGSRAYFQSVLFVQDGISSSMLEDIDSFDYDWLFRLVTRMHWGEDVTNLLLVGMPDVVTPAHYDSLENLYVQISGRKRVILFNPEYFRSLYPYPVGHPHDRQTQVEFDDPDFSRFPRFREIKGMEVALEPGEVLYIPSYWWHYIESEKENNTVSVNFWFDPKNESKSQTDQEKSDTTSSSSGVKEKDVEPQRAAVEQISQDHTSLEGKENGESENLQTQAEEPVNDEASSGDSETLVENSEEEEKEIDLTASGYLALVREIEVALFKATFSHKKVKQILEELLYGRFNNL